MLVDCRLVYIYIYIYIYINPCFCMSKPVYLYVRSLYPSLSIYLSILVCSYLTIDYSMFIIFTTPSARAGYDTRSIFKRGLTGWNSKFSFSETSCLTKAEEPSLPYYLPIAGGRIIGFIPFSRVLVLCEMQSVTSRIWTHVAVSISHDDNHYTTGTSLFFSFFFLPTPPLGQDMTSGQFLSGV